MSKEKTDSEKTYEERVEVFLKEYGELVKKHGLDMAMYPVYTPTGKPGVFETTIQQTVVDVVGQPTRSPFIPS